MTRYLMCLFAILLGLAACDSKSDKKVLSPNMGEEEVVVAQTEKEDTASWDLTKDVPLDSVLAMPVGTKMYFRTAFVGKVLEDFEVTLGYGKVVYDLTAPMPVIHLIASDPRLIALGGVSHGMSGSPVFTKDGKVGALSMSFDEQTEDKNISFFATSIEWMRKEIPNKEIRLGKPVVWRGHIVRPLALPLLMSGVNNHLLNAAILEYADKLGDGNLNMLSASGSAGAGGNIEQKFEDGSPLTAVLFTGDAVTIGATGTATDVRGNNILGFGHPFLGNGLTSLAMVATEILAEISGPSPFKFARLGNKVLGEIIYDRMPGVGGVLGQMPEMIPLVFNASIFGEKALSMNHQMSPVVLSGFDMFMQAIMAGTTLLSPLANRMDNVKDKSLIVRTQINFKDSNFKVDRERTYAQPHAGVLDLMNGPLFDFVGAYLGSVGNDYTDLKVSNIQMSVDVVDEPLFGVITGLEADSMVTAGSDLPVKVSLRVGATKDVDLNLTFAVPDSFEAGIYNLTVGSLASLRYFSYEPKDSGEFQNLEDVFEDINSPDGQTIIKLILSFNEPLPIEVPVDTLVSVVPDTVKVDSLGPPSIPSVLPPMLPPSQEPPVVYNDETSMEEKVDWVLRYDTGSIKVKVLENK
ncbi:MAG: hypothetical protein Q8R55_02885 [Candidatus Taylorbacteria bacterium]|nr:hypothetical protein [Candidatus Taylorbacteria bacterium]